MLRLLEVGKYEYIRSSDVTFSRCTPISAVSTYVHHKHSRVKLLQLIAINHNNSTLLFIQNHISKEASSLLFNPDFILNTSHIVFLSNVKYIVVFFIDDDIFQ